MKSSTIRRLEKAGWKVGSTQQFLDLSFEELALIDLKISLIAKLKEVRQNNKITQQALAKLLGSSQSRVAKLEAGESNISLDLICRALFALGLNKKQLGLVISGR